MTGQLIPGRPDLGCGRNSDFGKTYLKRFPPYVYSLLGGMLVHRVLRVEAQWYRAATIKEPGDALERLQSPRLTIEAVCGYSFYAGPHLKQERARACSVPKPDAVLCGRCVGTGPVFGRGLAELAVRRSEARRLVGCLVEVG